MRLPFLRPRTPRRVVTFHDATGTAERPTPPPQPHDLIDVVGIGATETVGGVTLTLLSVERYREGHVVLLRLLRPRGRLEREFPFPHLDLAVRPEGPVPYRFWMMGGGGGGMREVEYRLSYAIVPAPPRDADETVIEVRSISWDRQDGGTRKVVSVDPGPWHFSIGP
jgi:hypothetical protein